MANWSSGYVELFNHPTDTNAGQFTAVSKQGHPTSAVPVHQAPYADYPIPSFMGSDAGPPQVATGGSVSLF